MALRHGPWPTITRNGKTAPVAVGSQKLEDGSIIRLNGVYEEPCWWSEGNSRWCASVKHVSDGKIVTQRFNFRDIARSWAVAMCTQQPIPRITCDGGGFLPEEEDENCGSCGGCGQGGFIPEDEAVVPVPSSGVNPSPMDGKICNHPGKDCDCDGNCGDDCECKKPKVPEHPNKNRTHCVQCGQPTKSIPLLMSNLEVCQNKDCPLYDK